MINQPAAARGYQSVFWNISLYDEHYFSSIFEKFRFPNGTQPQWRSLNTLQHYFIDWFGIEREKAVLTFPVITAAMLTRLLNAAHLEMKYQTIPFHIL